MFQNFNDSQRPLSNTMCKHYGIYFQDAPRRLMTMGVLANETPSMDRSGSLTDGLIYCAGVRDEGIRHDWLNPHISTPIQELVAKKEPKKDKVITLDASPEGEDWVVNVISLAGEEVCSVRAQRTRNIHFLREQIQEAVDPGKEFNLHLALPGGNMVVNSKDDTSLQHLFMQDEAMALGLALEPDECTKVWQLFVKWDKDCSGEISKDELAAMLNLLDPSLSAEEISQVFDLLDVNKDNRLQWSEFLEVIKVIPDRLDAKP